MFDIENELTKITNVYRARMGLEPTLCAVCQLPLSECECEDSAIDGIDYEERDPITGMNEDERLDDPRHGQSDRGW